MNANIYEVKKTEKGALVVIVNTKNPQAATCISFDDGMDCLTAMSRVAQAFETLTAGETA